MTPQTVGPIGRLGRYTATHFRLVLAVWVIVALALGFFAPRVEKALSGAGWETTGSQSVAARNLIDQNFHGLSSYALMIVIHSQSETAGDPAFQRTVANVERTLRANPAVSTVVPPTPAISISHDGHTAIVQAGAARSSNAMVKAADEAKGKLAALSGHGIQVSLTGAPGMWSDFNAANRSAMLRSEMISWPVTLAILLLAFGSLVAAGLPLMLTMVGLASAAGMLYLGTLIAPISIWAMNFALMFALALGIDYALFIVYRFRGAFFGSRLSPTGRHDRDDGHRGQGGALQRRHRAHLAERGDARPEPGVSLDEPRNHARGRFSCSRPRSRCFPQCSRSSGPKVDRLALPWSHSGEHRSARFAAWGERLWRRPLAYGALALAILVGLAVPVTQLRTAMPSIKVVPSADSSRVGYEQVQAAFGPGATGPLQIVAPAAQSAAVASVVRADPGIAALLPLQTSNGHALATAIPKQDPSNPAVGGTIDRIRAELPAGALVGGAVAENHDLQAALSAATPLVIVVVLALGFLLLLIALQAPLIAAAGVLTSLLATGAAFGVAKWIFQDGALHTLLGFQPQGFLDAWGPVFFFAMIFAISMDYTVFLLSSAKEHWDRSHDPHEAMVGGVAHSGRVIFAAAAVMVAVFFTFALSGPLPPKEMGVILGVAVLLDATLVRLLLLPVLLRLMGRWAWYLPRWAHQVLPDVRFGHA